VIGFQYCPGGQFSATAFLQELEPGSQYCPGGQLMGWGCAAPLAAVTTESAAIGAETAATIAVRSNFDMLVSCPEIDDFKPAGVGIHPTTMRSFSHPRTVEVGASCAVS